MDRLQRARREHRALHALLAAVLHEGPQGAELPELGLVDGGLGADGQGLAHLRDDDADLARRDLNPRELLDREDRPELPAQARHEELGLISRLAAERDRIVLRELPEAEAFRDEADLRRPDAVQREQHDDERQRGDGDEEEHERRIESEHRGPFLRALARERTGSPDGASHERTEHELRTWRREDPGRPSRGDRGAGLLRAHPEEQRAQQSSR